MRFQSNSPGSGGFLSPQKIIDQWDFVQKGMKIADFGSGAGYFTIPLAKKVGPDGKVFAIDIRSEVLEVISSKAKIDGIENIITVRCDLEKKNSSGIEDNFCDIILIANLFFQTENDEEIVREAKRILKKDGKVIFIDWKPDVSFGPQGKKIKKEDAIRLFNSEGLLLEKEFDTDNYHYGLIFNNNIKKY